MNRAKNRPKPIEIGKRLTLERCRLKLKAINIYEALDIHQNTYRNYEQGNRDIPASMLQHLAKMGFDVYYIITGINTPDSLMAKQRRNILPTTTLTDNETKKLKTLVDIHNKLTNAEQKELISLQIDELLGRT